MRDPRYDELADLDPLAQHRMRPEAYYADPSSAAAHDTSTRTLPAVPDWVQDPAKWVALSRADRRALERHHRKVNGRG